MTYASLGSLRNNTVYLLTDSSIGEVDRNIALGHEHLVGTPLTSVEVETGVSIPSTIMFYRRDRNYMTTRVSKDSPRAQGEPLPEAKAIRQLVEILSESETLLPQAVIIEPEMQNAVQKAIRRAGLNECFPKQIDA